MQAIDPGYFGIKKQGGITTTLPFSSRKKIANVNVANTEIFVWGFVKGRLESRQIGFKSGWLCTPGNICLYKGSVQKCMPVKNTQRVQTTWIAPNSNVAAITIGHHPLTGKEYDKTGYDHWSGIDLPIRRANCWLFSLVFQFFIKLKVQFFLIIRETSHLRDKQKHN